MTPLAQAPSDLAFPRPEPSWWCRALARWGKRPLHRIFKLSSAHILRAWQGWLGLNAPCYLRAAQPVPVAQLAPHLRMGRYTTTAILLAAAPRPAQANIWPCYNFSCMAIPWVVLFTLVFLATSSCFYAHGVCSCTTQDDHPKSQRGCRVLVQACAFINAIAAIIFTAIFGLLMMATGWWQQPVACLFFALAALAAVLGSLGADRRCKKGAEDADEPPVVAPKEPV